ncbi:MAG TPA: WbqC family protein [Terriglobales bacterium]|nr:WbqC family protein [Terriglobales bacterium]
MKVAIVQPTYLPWLGYFDLLDQVDRLVLLDSVQFEKRSWQQRNRIKTPEGLQWLTVPVASRGRRDQRIVEVEISEPEFWRDHLRAIDLNYRRAPFFETYFGPVSEVICSESADRNLARLLTGIIRWIRDVLGIKTEMICSSEILVEGKRSQLLAEICAAQGAKEYLSPLGSVDYLLDELAIFADRGITVSFQHYEHPSYEQLFPPFRPYASVLDLLFNEGDRALSIIRSGRRTAYTPEQARAFLADRHKGKSSEAGAMKVVS